MDASNLFQEDCIRQFAMQKQYTRVQNMHLAIVLQVTTTPPPPPVNPETYIPMVAW